MKLFLKFLIIISAFFVFQMIFEKVLLFYTTDVYILQSLGSLVFAVMILAFRSDLRNKLSFANTEKIKVRDSFKMGMILWVGYLILIALLVSILTLMPTLITSIKASDFNLGAYPLGPFWLHFLAVAVVGPICEELLFRGYILPKLTESHSLKRANIIQALIFAVIHGSIIKLVFVFIKGVIYGRLAYTSKTLWPSILLHSINNLFSVIGLYTLSTVENVNLNFLGAFGDYISKNIVFTIVIVLFELILLSMLIFKFLNIYHGLDSSK